jgi:hypothetical protein
LSWRAEAHPLASTGRCSRCRRNDWWALVSGRGRDAERVVVPRHAGGRASGGLRGNVRRVGADLAGGGCATVAPSPPLRRQLVPPGRKTIRQKMHSAGTSGVLQNRWRRPGVVELHRSRTRASRRLTGSVRRRSAQTRCRRRTPPVHLSLRLRPRVQPVRRGARHSTCMPC